MLKYQRRGVAQLVARFVRPARHSQGVVQLVERYVRDVEVGGSSPLTLT